MEEVEGLGGFNALRFGPRVTVGAFTNLNSVRKNCIMNYSDAYIRASRCRFGVGVLGLFGPTLVTSRTETRAACQAENAGKPGMMTTHRLALKFGVQGL